MLDHLIVASVGHGMCCACRSAGETVVIDCGGKCRDLPATVLGNIGYFRRPRAFVLSHFHSDHYNGLVHSIRMGSPACATLGSVYHPRMPAIWTSDLTGRRDLGPAFLSRLIAMNVHNLGGQDYLNMSRYSLSPTRLDVVDLLSNATHNEVVAVGLSAGEAVPFGDTELEVLWPPRELDDAEIVADVRRAIEKFDDACNADPALRALHPPDGGTSRSEEVEAADGLCTEDTWEMVKQADKAIRKAANRLSLAFRGADRLLFLGDLEKREIAEVTGGLLARGYDRFEEAISPHHGTHWHEALGNLRITGYWIHSLAEEDQLAEGFRDFEVWLTHTHGTFSGWQPCRWQAVRELQPHGTPDRAGSIRQKTEQIKSDLQRQQQADLRRLLEEITTRDLAPHVAREMLLELAVVAEKRDCDGWLWTEPHELPADVYS